MIMVFQASFPTDRAEAAGKALLKLPPLPDSITMYGPYITTALGEGVKAMGIYEFDASMYKEAYKILNERAAVYIGVPGLTYSLTQWLEPQDALPLIGLA